MNRRAYTPVAVVLAVSALALVAPALVLAASGGGSPTGGSSPSGSAPSSSPQVKPGNVTVMATGDGVTVETRASEMLRSPTRFFGNVGTGAAGDTVEIERRGRETGWTWARTTHGTAAADGSFSALLADEPHRPLLDPRGRRAEPNRPRRGVIASADDHRLPTFVCHVLRPRILRPANRLWGRPAPADAGGRQPDAEVRHAGRDRLRRPDDRRARDRPRALRPRRRLGSHAGDRQAARDPGIGDDRSGLTPHR